MPDKLERLANFLDNQLVKLANLIIKPQQVTHSGEVFVNNEEHINRGLAYLEYEANKEATADFYMSLPEKERAIYDNMPIIEFMQQMKIMGIVKPTENPTQNPKPDF